MLLPTARDRPEVEAWNDAIVRSRPRSRAAPVLINAGKTRLRRTGLRCIPLRGEREHKMPDRVNDECHLHMFSGASVLTLIPADLLFAHLQTVPACLLRLRYAVRCEAT